MSTSTLLPEITVLFRPQEHFDLARQLDDLWQFSRTTAAWGPNYATWYVSGASREESLLNFAFNDDGPTPAAYAVIRTQNGGSCAATDFGFWNGRDGKEAAGIGYALGSGGLWTVSFRPRVDASIAFKHVAMLLETAASLWSPLLITAFPFSYFQKQVFKDRPGVGWMLYLPRVLTVKQVPEARALVPVMGKDEKGKDRQIGTIIVSVTDAPFSDENAEHVKIANAIEIRLVDQDLLPRYADL